MPRLISYSTAAATSRLVPTGDKFAFRRREIKFPRSNPPGRRIVTQENLHSVNKSVNISNSRRTKNGHLHHPRSKNHHYVTSLYFYISCAAWPTKSEVVRYVAFTQDKIFVREKVSAVLV